MERRIKRSQDRSEALQYLVEALADRSDVDAVVLLDDHGKIVAGMGVPERVRGLATIAVPVMEGRPCDDFAAATRGTDFFGRRIANRAGTGDNASPLYLAALGNKLRKMHEAVYAIARIMDRAPSPPSPSAVSL